MIGRSSRRVLPAALVTLAAVCLPLAVAGSHTALDVVTVGMQNPTAKPLGGLAGVAATTQSGRRITGNDPL